MHPRITAVQCARSLRGELTFTDGSHGTADLSPWIRGRQGVFAVLQNPSFFAQVSVDREAGTIVWPNGADVDPDVLYLTARGTRTPA